VRTINELAVAAVGTLAVPAASLTAPAEASIFSAVVAPVNPNAAEATAIASAVAN
jgi:hypothetical protein